MIRFQAAIHAMNKSPNISLTDLALGLGYFDQSHFTKDFTSHSGMTPKKYLKHIQENNLNKKILYFLTKNQLALLRNCFYAIHGYEFKNQKTREYFQNFPWYKVAPDFSESNLNTTEKENIELIKNVEKSNSKECSSILNGLIQNF